MTRAGMGLLTLPQASAPQEAGTETRGAFDICLSKGQQEACGLKAAEEAGAGQTG